MQAKQPITIEVGWASMQVGIDKLIRILERHTDEHISVVEFMTLYTTIYNMCTQKAPYEYSEELYKRYKKTFDEYLSTSVKLKLDATDMGEQLLKAVRTAWDNHQIMVRWLSRFFNYLDRYYVVRHNLNNLNDVGLMCFRDVVFRDVKVRAKDALLELLEREREGESIDRDLVKSTLSIYIDVGMNELSVYKQEFERHLLAAIHSHYQRKAALWIQEDSCPEYLKKAEKCLLDEEERANYYLHAESVTPVLEAVQEELLCKVEQTLIEKDSGCAAMLQDNKMDDLARLCRVFSRVTDGLAPIAEIFRKHIEQEGMALVNDVIAAASNANAAGGKKEAAVAEQKFIKLVLDLQDKYLRVVNLCFKAHTLMHKALKEAFEMFCNKSMQNMSTMPELMVNYCDTLLRKGGGEKLSDEELDDTLENLVKLLAYVSDKDMFSEFYRKKLARRLLSGSGNADDHETTFLQRLKQQCGAQYTQKMEGMVNDLRGARQKQHDFEIWLKNHSDLTTKVDLDVKVLTTGFWPSYKTGDLALPAEMAECVEAFQKFYEADTNHRKLAWVHSLGNMTVKAQFKKQKKELVLTPYQAAALMLFNDVEELSYTDVRERLNLPDDEVVRTLFSLTCAKHHILRKVSDGDAGKAKAINKDDRFAVNMDFTDKMVRIRVPMPQQDEKRKVVDDVQKDRRHAIDAAIVRIMKSRKSLEHQQLVMEVMQQVKRMFSTDNRAIKKRLEDLISRDFLKRDPDNPNLYQYIA